MGSAAFLTDAKTLGQVDFDEVAIMAAEFAKRIQCLDDTGSARPARAHASRQRHHGNAPCGKGIETGRTMTIIEAIRRGILNEAGGGQAVLRQTDAA